MTGLSRENSEDLQVQAYGIGGYYGPHYDYQTSSDSSSGGNRIATLMFYVTFYFFTFYGD